MTYEATIKRYSDKMLNTLGDIEGVPTEDDYERANRFLRATDSGQLEAWSEVKTKTYNLNGQRFRMLVDRPKHNTDNKAVVVMGEFGNGIAPAAVARACIIRDMVAPEAPLVYQPNTTIDQPNVNLSLEEKAQLRRGNLAPMIGRISVVLHELGCPRDMTIYGPSQGGAVALGFAADENTPSTAVATIEMPNVVHRSVAKMMMDFLGSGGQLKDIIGENYADEATPFLDETLRGLNLAKYAAGLLRGDNTAQRGILRRNTAESLIRTVLKKEGSVVQAYGTVDRVSPVAENEVLAQLFSEGPHSPRYRAVSFEGADHSLTNQYVVNGALARAARNLWLLGQSERLKF